MAPNSRYLMKQSTAEMRILEQSQLFSILACFCCMNSYEPKWFSVDEDQQGVGGGRWGSLISTFDCGRYGMHS